MNMIKDEYKERKEQRKQHYKKNVEGWKQIPCYACNGTGYYDNANSPHCSSCDGTGKEKVSPEKFKNYLKIKERIYGK